MAGSLSYQTPETTERVASMPATPDQALFEQPYGNEAMQDLLRADQAPATTNPTPIPDILSLREVDHDPGRPTRMGLDTDSVRAVQARLAELNYPVPVTGEMDATTTAALERFQVEHADEISQVVQDASLAPYNIDEATYSDGRQVSDTVIEGMNIATRSPLRRDQSGQVIGASGRIRANDATHQVLANTWRGANDAEGNATEGRRRINGELMTEQQTFDYLTAQMAASDVPFQEGITNVLGVRGQEGGVANDNQGVFQAGNRYNDTMYMLSRDGEQGHVQMFRASVDPGVGENAGFQVHDGQQWDYRMVTTGAGPKYNRPWLNPTMRRGGEDNVLDPARGSDPQDSLRVLGHGGREVEQRTRFAMHSGGNGGASGDVAGADSNGCQVVHGAWYGHYMESLRRGMAEDSVNERGEIGRLRYTLLESGQLAPPGEARSSAAP